MKYIIRTFKGEYEVEEGARDAAARAMAHDGIVQLRDHGVMIKGSAIMEIAEKTDEPEALPSGQYHNPKLGDGPPDLPEPDETEFERQRVYMEKIRKNLAERKKWDD